MRKVTDLGIYEESKIQITEETATEGMLDISVVELMRASFRAGAKWMRGDYVKDVGFSKDAFKPKSIKFKTKNDFL